MTPVWILDAYAAIMLAVAAVSAARLVAAPPWQRTGTDAGIDVGHLLMGVSMAGMLAAGLRTLPDGAWEVIFAALTVWFAWWTWREVRGYGARVLVSGHHASHLVHAAAMLYMFLAVTAPAASRSGMGGMGGMGGTASSGAAMQSVQLPGLALLFALLLAGYAVRDLDCVSALATSRRQRRTAPGPVRPVAVPAATGTGPAGTRMPAAPPGLSPSPRPNVATVAEPRPAETGPVGHIRGGTPATSRTATREPMLTPAVAASCRIAMGITMSFMLIVMF